ncbi:family 78 glycoside hydrolase catalytic domain [Sphingomonas canadensis]
MIDAFDPRCEGAPAPLALAGARPLFTWGLAAAGRGRRPGGFRLMLAPDAEGATDWEAPLWDSGPREWTGLPQLRYEGPALAPSTAYRWRVRMRDEAGRWGGWSEARLETAPDRWRGEWISQILPPAPCWRPRRPELRGEIHRNHFGALPALLLRGGFMVRGAVRRARLHATARGLYLASVNGEACNPGALAPGWTDYRRRIAYQTHDVTALLRPGANMLAAVLGEGWYSGRISEHAKYPAGHYGPQPWFTCQLMIEYADGQTEWLGSGPQWRVAQGPIAYSDLLNGEVFDARQDWEGWMLPGFDDGGWAPVSVRPIDGVPIEPDIAPPVRTTQVLAPVSIMREGGRALADFGQNHAGRLRLRVSGEAGAALRIRHAEILDADGALYSANLLRAAQTDTHVCDGAGPRDWEPAFTIHGFRHAELTGLDRVKLHAIESRVLHADLDAAGSFACGHAMVERLLRNIGWGLRSNLQAVPTDCPSRDERLGWLADAQLIAGTAACLFDVRGYFAKWLQDIRDAQAADGTVPDMAPFLSPAFDFFADGAAGWADAAVIVPWTLWRRYGDPGLVDSCWRSMAAWMASLDRRFPDGLRRGVGNNYGDWLAIDAGTDRDLIATALYVQAAAMMADMAEGTGREAEALYYRALEGMVRRRFCAAFLVEGGSLSTPTQAGYAIAIGTGAVPAGVRGAMADRLAGLIAANGGALSTGFLGTRYLLAALSDHGHARLAYDLLLRTAYPSWGYMIGQGATTLWERWNSLGGDAAPADPSMNSFNHAALGSVGQWLFEDAAGIRGAAPGWSAVTIRPRFDARLGWCEASQRAASGVVRVRWEFAGADVRLDFTVPPGTQAEVLLPVAPGAIGGADAAALAGVTARDGAGTRIAAESGDYSLLIAGVGLEGSSQA